MNKACKNCEYLVRKNMYLGLYRWGHCQKHVTNVEEADGNRKGEFRWAEDSCPHFKAKQRHDESSHTNTK